MCAFIVAIAACSTVSQPPPPSRYTAPTSEVTNGVCVVFSAAPATAVSAALVDAGATINSSGTVFAFDAINTDARRQAVTSALLSGAELKGLSR